MMSLIGPIETAPEGHTGMGGNMHDPETRLPLFLLGGHDLEMLTIRELLIARAVPFVDKDLAWHQAKASAYRMEIDAALRESRRPVAVELTDDLPPDLSQQVMWIDHHGERAGADRRSSLRQVFDLLRLPGADWTRDYALVAANDIGHVRAMAALGATPEELRSIRAADRAAQGVSAEEEAQGAAALQQRQRLLPDLDVVRLPHNRSSVVTDLLDPLLGGDGAENLLVITPTAWNVYGRGALVLALTERYGGWHGGALPERGFWGHERNAGLDNEILEFLRGRLERDRYRRVAAVR